MALISADFQDVLKLTGRGVKNRLDIITSGVIRVMNVNPELISPCGLYCGVCAVYMAHRDNNDKFKERLVTLYKGEVPGKGILPNSGAPRAGARGTCGAA